MSSAPNTELTPPIGLPPPLAAEVAATRRSLGRLAGTGLGALVGGIGDVHHGIAYRTFDALGAVGAPVRVVHDTIADGVYAAVGLGLRGVARATGEAAARLPEDEVTPAEAAVRERRRTLLVGILNGTWGDHLEAAQDPLAWPMTLRQGGQDVPIEPRALAALAAQHPGSDGRLVVFVHGLHESDRSWWRGAEQHHGDASTSLGTTLRSTFGLAPLHVRYNTGLTTAENGRRLDALLDSLVAAWPGGVRELVLVGHSMGGLVARSACATAVANASDGDGTSHWPSLLTHTVSLGAPHLGAPLERQTARLVPQLARLPETRPVAAALRARSIGIKWLRHGSILDGDHPADPDDPRLDPRVTTPLPANGRHHAIAATRTGTSVARPTRAGGDGIVPVASAHGQHRQPSRSVGFAADDLHVLSGLAHLDLLNHPRVHRLLVELLGPVRDDSR